MKKLRAHASLSGNTKRFTFRNVVLTAIVPLIALMTAAAYSGGVSVRAESLFGALGLIGPAPQASQHDVSFDAAEPMASAASTTNGSTLAARTGHTATLLDSGDVLIVGGDTGGTAEIYDPDSGTSTATGRLSQARLPELSLAIWVSTSVFTTLRKVRLR